MDKESLINRIIDACYQVHLALKPGFLESVYHNALLVELKSHGLRCQSEKPLYVSYKGYTVGEFRADVIVENMVIIEIKAVSQINIQHEVQLVNYLTCTGIDTGILVNFGSEKIQIRRKFREFRP